ncbi:MAG TPA: histidine kinase [Saprospiraceae bacterium]|nr:histidine kinase [Saprospiraceae bacterium]HMQ85558.1 histidine kinase [Saprospiraceae bacterium]
MKKHIGSLLLWTFVFYYVFGPIQDWAATGDAEEVYVWLTNWKDFWLVSTSMLSFAAYSVGAYLSFYHTYPKRLYVQGILLLLLTIPTAIAFRFFIQEVLMPLLLGFGNYAPGYTMKYYFFDNLYYAFVFSAFGVIFFFLRYANYKEQQEKALAFENQQMQLSQLKSQLNPHFLFNALNNIYALVYEKSPHALAAVEKLSHLLRYSLYEKSDRVPLSKEWQFATDFMDMQRLRLAYEPVLDIDIPAPLPDVNLPPFTLIPFIENAFKHGDLQNPNAPLRIHMDCTDTHFQFSMSNQISQQQKDQTGGIGLENTRRRLDQYFDHQHELTITAQDHEFVVCLKIPLRLCSNA